MLGTPPVATTTMSGSSASTSSASASMSMRTVTPASSTSRCSQSVMPMISRRRSRRAGEVHLPAQPVGGLDAGSPRGRARPRRGPPQARPARRHDDHALPRPGPAHDDVRHGPLAPGRRVVQAQGVAADIDPVDAVAGADARADAILLAALAAWPRCAGRRGGHGSCRPCRHSLRPRRAARCEVGDAGGVEDRQAGCRPDRPGMVEIGCRYAGPWSGSAWRSRGRSWRRQPTMLR